MALAAALGIALATSSGSGGEAQAGDVRAGPDVTCLGGQCFTDVPPGNSFFIYIGFAGRVKMKVAGQANVGNRLAVGSDGTAVVSSRDSSGEIFGKVASRPASDGTVDVIVSFK